MKLNTLKAASKDQARTAPSKAGKDRKGAESDDSSDDGKKTDQTNGPKQEKR